MGDKRKHSRRKLPSNEERVTRLRDYLKEVAEGKITIEDWTTFPETLGGTRDFLLPQANVFPVTNTNILTRTHPRCGPIVDEIKGLLNDINKLRPTQEPQAEKPKTKPTLTPEELQERIARREYLAQWSKARLEAEEAGTMGRELKRLRGVEDERDSALAELERLRLQIKEASGEIDPTEPRSGPRGGKNGKNLRGTTPHLRLVK